jgi:hypothetical protein
MEGALHGPLNSLPLRQVIATVTAPEPDGKFHYRRKNNDTFRLIQKILRNIVGDIEDLNHYFASILNAIVFVFLRVCR